MNQNTCWYLVQTDHSYHQTVSQTNRTIKQNTHRGRSVLKVQVCDPLEAIPRPIGCDRSDSDFNKRCIRSGYHPDEQRHSFQCRSSAKNDGTRRNQHQTGNQKTGTDQRYNRGKSPKLENFSKINISADQPLWGQYVEIAVMAHNTT